MKIDRDLLKRFKLFGSGMFLGILLLLFFFNGKKSKCTWFPNEKALAYIRNKNIEYAPSLRTQLTIKRIDSSTINQILLKGNINFSKSKQRQKPCQKYWIDGFALEKKVTLHVTVCDTIATLSKLDFRK
ncbi:MAG: hypothetical protein L3J23_07925 [Flavobacteriaceae bacterium]|nr:hypothetical protein [Flavobacteriaceae bacterium]